MRLLSALATVTSVQPHKAGADIVQVVTDRPLAFVGRRSAPSMNRRVESPWSPPSRAVVDAAPSSSVRVAVTPSLRVIPLRGLASGPVALVVTHLSLSEPRSAVQVTDRLGPAAIRIHNRDVRSFAVAERAGAVICPDASLWDSLARAGGDK